MKSFSFHVDSTSGNGTESDITGLTLIGVTLSGSTTADRSVVFEVADSIGTFSAVKCTNIDTLVVVSATALTGTTPHRFQCPVGGFKKFRVRIVGGSSGTLTAVGLGLAKAPPSRGGATTITGSTITLDLNNSGPIESTSLEAIATTGDLNNIFTSPTLNKLLIDMSKKWPSAALADALSVNGANCPLGQAASGVDASGASEGCFTPSGASGTSLDLGNTGPIESTALQTIATTGDTNAIFTEPTPDKLLIDVSKKWPSAVLSDAFSINGSNCPLGQAAGGISANGTAEDCFTPTISLDLNNSGPIESTALQSIATTGDTNAIFTEPTPDKLLIDVSKKWPSAILADSLSVNPTNCPPGQAAGGISASGIAEDCFTPVGGGGSSSFNALTSGNNTTASMICSGGCTLSGNITASAFSANPTNCPGGQAAGGIDASGNAEGCFTPATGAPSFSALTSGTNTNAAMLCGAGCSLGPTSTGTISANALTGTVTIPTGSSLAPTGTGTNTANALTGTIVLPGGASIAPGSGTITANALGGAITVPTGSSLAPSGSGTVTANALTGNIILPSGAALSPGSGTLTANALSGTVVVPTGSSLAASGTGTITATTATALSTNPAACAANNFVIDIDANGTLTCLQPASSTLSDAASLVTLTGVQTLHNKEIVPREATMTPVANEIEPNCASASVVVVNALSANVTIKNPLCTPKPSQEIDFRFFCSAQRLIFWGNQYSTTAGVPLLGVCTGDGTTYDYIKYRWNSINSFWESIAVKATGKGVATLASSTTFTPPADVASRVEMQMTGVSGTLTIAAPSPSTPTNGDLMWLAIQCTNLQTLAWNAIYLNGIYQTKPATCPANVNTWLEVLVRYSSVESGWVVLVGASATAGITVQEVDGTPTGTFTTLRFSNGSMTDNGGGTATIVTSGSSSFTVTKNLPITGVKFPTTDPARLDRSLAFDRLLFNDTTQQCAIWQFIWPSDYTSGGSLKIIYSMLSDTNVAHNLAFDVSFKAITPGDATTIITKAFSGSVNSCDDSAIPSVAQRPDVITCTLTNTDSVAAGDLVQIQLCRDVANDNSTGDAEVEGVELSYVH